MFPDEVLTITNLTDVHTKMYDARIQWFNIGLALKIEYGTLMAIKDECNDNSSCLQEMLAHCIESRNLTWQDICACLRRKTVGCSHVAEEIEDCVKSESLITNSLSLNFTCTLLRRSFSCKAARLFPCRY